jgi:hypothetical protein
MTHGDVATWSHGSDNAVRRSVAGLHRLTRRRSYHHHHHRRLHPASTRWLFAATAVGRRPAARALRALSPRRAQRLRRCWRTWLALAMRRGHAA